MTAQTNHEYLASKYAEIIKRTAIDIKADPVKILELKHGDIVLLGEVLLEVEESHFADEEDERIYLTTLDSRISEYYKSNGVYQDFIKHMRGLDHASMMTRHKMKRVIESGEYTIS